MSKSTRSKVYIYSAVVFLVALLVVVSQIGSDVSDDTSPRANALKSLDQLENETPLDGDRIAETSTIDYELQEYVYRRLEETALRFGYSGGSGVVMDIETGEILVLSGYPEFDSENSVHFNRATHGLYAPGSVIKPFVAIAALSEGIIHAEKEILSTGSIQIQNPFQEGMFSVFNDWKAHGWVDMRKAIGVSSNIYFYSIGGGFEDQEGLGIERLEKYIRLFGIGSTTGIDLVSESEGFIPNPEWKKREYAGDDWRIGDTYLASIGQHGYEVTPLQLVKATAAIANGGMLLSPTLQNNRIDLEKVTLPIKEEHFKIVREGMEYAVTNGTASGLYLDNFTLAAKTGTVEVDTNKEFIHSWLIGYFLHDKPRYVFTFMLDKALGGQKQGR